MAPLIWLGRLVVVLLRVLAARRCAARGGACRSGRPSTPHRERCGPIRYGHRSHLAGIADLAIWTFVVFVVLLAVLEQVRLGADRAGARRARARRSPSNIAAAEARQPRGQAMLAEYEQKLAGAADEVRAMLEEARRDAEHTKQEIVAEASVAAKAEHDRAMRDIETATDQALKELAETQRQPGGRPGRQDHPRSAEHGRSHGADPGGDGQVPGDGAELGLRVQGSGFSSA